MLPVEDGRKRKIPKVPKRCTRGPIYRKIQKSQKFSFGVHFWAPERIRPLQWPRGGHRECSKPRIGCSTVRHVARAERVGANQPHGDACPCVHLPRRLAAPAMLPPACAAPIPGCHAPGSKLRPGLANRSATHTENPAWAKRPTFKSFI